MKSSADHSFHALRSLARHYTGRMIVLNLARAIAAMLVALHPLFLANLADSSDDKDRAFLYLMLLLGTGAAHGLIWTIADFATSRWVNPLSYELKQIGFEAFWGNDYKEFVDRPSGKAGSYVNDLQRHSLMLWDTLHYGFLPMVAALPIYILLFFQVSWQNSVAYGVFLTVACVALTWVSKPVQAAQHALTDTVATNNGRVFDSYSNFVNVFSFRAQLKEISRQAESTTEMQADEVRASSWLSAYWATASFLVRIVLWSVVIGYNWYLYDRGSISFAAFFLSLTVLLDFSSQYWNLVHNLGQWVDTSASYRAAYTYLFPDENVVATHYAGSRSAELAELPSEPEQRFNHALELRDVSFAYPDRPDTLVLNNISLRVEKGERVGIVGRSGEGKSTLIKILLGFYAPTSGDVLIDGTPVEADRLQGLMAYVPQDTALFQESVEYNIEYASRTDLSRADVRAAAHKAHIGDFIESLPDGYETLVGERGIKLSLGQRQRIAIARAFVKSSDLLVLDEATSALDSETESLIQASLENLSHGKASIVIAHRLATLNSMDRIIVIEDGRIVEEGPKDELLAAGGPFADLWDLQRSGTA